MGRSTGHNRCQTDLLSAPVRCRITCSRGRGRDDLSLRAAITRAVIASSDGTAIIYLFLYHLVRAHTDDA